MGLIEIEEKIKNWIEENRSRWCFILFFLGIFLGTFLGSLLDLSIIKNVGWGVGFGFFLVIIEIVAGGSGID